MDPELYGREKQDQYQKIQSLGEGRYAQVFKYVCVAHRVARRADVRNGVRCDANSGTSKQARS